MNELDRIAREYHLTPQKDMFIENICQEYEIEWVKQKIAPNSSVLELGFGDGITFRSLAHHCQLSVVDGSQLIVDEAQRVREEIGADAMVYKSYFEEFEPDTSFDYVFASHVLEHVANPDLIVEKFDHWLKPTGQAIIVVPNSQSIHRRLATIMGLQPRLDSLSARDLLVGHLRVYDLSEMESLLRTKGWEIVERRGFFLKPLSNSQMINFDSNLIRAMCEISDSVPPDLCANIALVVSRKN